MRAFLWMITITTTLLVFPVSLQDAETVAGSRLTRDGEADSRTVSNCFSIKSDRSVYPQPESITIFLLQYRISLHSLRYTPVAILNILQKYACEVASRMPWLNNNLRHFATATCNGFGLAYVFKLKTR